ncbi:hypothetical protein HHSLTHF2_31320 [Vreelandella venusta]|uniref:Uncharacterized protein n=1 Tax=Halomonas hydrothermalis TaxID=115561 RepID=A0A6F8U6Y4_9GAMM|nr:hypothetical protein HHSLTHF2_31320 [Halomonas hydrothermalis]
MTRGRACGNDKGGVEGFVRHLSRKTPASTETGVFVGDIGYGLSEKSLRASCTEDLDAWNGKN